MKNMKKLFSLALALVMMMALVVTAGAQTATTHNQTTGTITVTDAYVGETYTLVKVFDATVNEYNSTTPSENDGKGVAYTIPSGSSIETYTTTVGEGADETTLKFSDFFTKTNGTIEATTAAKDSTGNLSESAQKFLKAWAEANKGSDPTNQKATGNKVVFNNVPFGYYVIISTVDGGAAISVTSTDPNAVINEKNEQEGGFKGDDGKHIYKRNADGTLVLENGKPVEIKTVQIGETVTYTIEYTTSNYTKVTTADNKTEMKLVEKYVVIDTLPDFLANVITAHVEVQDKDGKVLNGDGKGEDKTFVNKQFEITWAEAPVGSNEKVSLYPTGAKLVITYNATVVSTGNNGAYTNKVTIKPNGEGNGHDSSNTVYSATIGVYKHGVEEGTTKTPLDGAKFKLYREGSTGKEYYKLTSKPVNDVTTYAVSWVAEADASEFETNEQGNLKLSGTNQNIIGLEADVYYLEETVAPEGYNKLANAIKLTVVETTGEDGKVNGVKVTSAMWDTEKETYGTASNVEQIDGTSNTGLVSVLNLTGTELPSTGGIGTTIFTVTGAILMIGAAVLFLTKKRSEA